MNRYIPYLRRNTVAFTVGTISCFLVYAVDMPAAIADESESAELTRPQSKIEAGVGEVTDGSWKFGQYNGLNNAGPFGIGNFDISGGGAYDSDDATRWRLIGRNLGLETRSFSAEFQDQGKFKLNAGYEEIPMYLNNSYQTPYRGIGGGNLTLPSNWQYPTTANNMRTLPLSDYSDFETVTMGTKRKRVDGGFSYSFDPQWEGQVSFRHENKNGLQTLGAPLVATRSVILPNPIAQTTDQVNANMRFTNDKGFAQFAYYGSIFHNDITEVDFQNAYASGLPTFGRMSSMPDNQFHQFSLTGGYNFNPNTKLVANGSYALNFQNQAFLPYNTLPGGGGGLPASSLNGNVQTSNIDLKLTHKVDSDLNFAATYKFNNRENYTPINTYNFADVDSTGAATNYRSNTPFSKRLQQGNLDANYSFAKGHWLKAGYEVQNIERWCNGSWVSCVDTGTTTENIGRLDYRGNFFETLSSKLGYAYSYRNADHYNQDNAFWASFPSSNLALYNSIAATGLPAWGPFLPYAAGNAALYPAVFPNNNPATAGNPANNAVDINGLERFNTSDRQRQKVNGYLDYPINDKISLGVGGDWRHDNYPNAVFGLQSTTNWTANLDTNYVVNENTNLQLFYSYQDIHNKSAGMSYSTNTNTGTTTPGSVVGGGCVNNILAMNNNAKVNPCLNWLTNMQDNINTVGFGVKRKGFLEGKLDVNSNFLYSFANTLIGVTGGQYVLNPAGTTANGPYLYIPASNMPPVKTQTIQFMLDLKYTINKPSAVHFSYMYQYMFNTDYVYTGMQPSGTPTGVMPTLSQAPTYSISVIGLSYIYTF